MDDCILFSHRYVIPWIKRLALEFYAISSFASPIKKSAKNILLTYPYDFVEVYDFFSLIYNFPFLTILSTSGSQCVVPRLTASASPGYLLIRHITRLHSRTTESEILGVWPSNLCYSDTSRWFWYLLICENCGSKVLGGWRDSRSSWPMCWHEPVQYKSYSNAGIWR